IAMKNTDDPLIFISHAPPLDSEADITRAGEHVGSSSVRKFVEDYQPEIILCGHIHESESISKIEKTLCINPGPFAHGNVAIAVIEIDDSKGVKTKGKILTI
nr:metallophosphoesterase [Asgard group archaeon]